MTRWNRLVTSTSGARGTVRTVLLVAVTLAASCVPPQPQPPSARSRRVPSLILPGRSGHYFVRSPLIMGLEDVADQPDVIATFDRRVLQDWAAMRFLLDYLARVGDCNDAKVVDALKLPCTNGTPSGFGESSLGELTGDGASILDQMCRGRGRLRGNLLRDPPTSSFEREVENLLGWFYTEKVVKEGGVKGPFGLLDGRVFGGTIAWDEHGFSAPATESEPSKFPDLGESVPIETDEDRAMAAYFVSRIGEGLPMAVVPNHDKNDPDGTDSYHQRDDGSVVNDEDEPPPPPEPTAPDTGQPPGPEGAVDEFSLDAFCQAHWRASYGRDCVPGNGTTFEDCGKAAVDDQCDDPMEDPAGDESTERIHRRARVVLCSGGAPAECGPVAGSAFLSVKNLCGNDRGSCGPLAQPGVDGSCWSRAGWGRAAGDVVPRFQRYSFCNPAVCDPGIREFILEHAGKEP